MPKSKWTFITNHASVLTLLNHKDHLTSREIALALDITERSVIRIIKELESAGYVTKHKEGRNNCYTINEDLPLRRNDQREVSVYELLQFLSRNK
jgi:predicted transcriptional regulator